MAELSGNAYTHNTNPLDSAEKAVGLMRSATGLQSDKFELAKKQLQQMQSMFGTLALKKDLTHDDVVNTGLKGVSLGLWSPKQLAVELGNVPAKPSGNSPEDMQKYQAQLKQYATGHLENVMTASERFNQQNPQPQWIDNGQNKYPIAQSGLNPYPTVTGPPLQNQLSPGEYYAPERGPNVNGQPTSITRGQHIEGATGQPPAGYPSTGYGQQPPQGYPKQETSQEHSGAADWMHNATPPTGSHAPGGGLVMGNAPGFDKAAEAKAATSGEMSDALAKAIDTSPQRKAALGNLDSLIEQFTSGPGATDWNKVKAGVNANLPVPAGWEVFNPKNIGSQEEFRKQAVDLARQQFAAMGGTGTDQKLSSAMLVSPSEELSKMGNKSIIALLRGNEDALKVKDKAWDQWQQGGHGPQTMQEFNREFYKHFDPRVFQFKHLNSDEQAKMYKTMSKADKTKFRSNMEAAEQNDWLSQK